MNRSETSQLVIDLAKVLDFSLGSLLVSPSLREIRVGEIAASVEPRVMQVLVALARADGAVVSRDDLIASCWSGRIVGDDAVNRCIARVRGIAELADPSPFEVTTVPRVGYRLKRLVKAPSPPAAELVTAPAANAAGSHRWVWASAGASVAALALALGYTFWPKPVQSWQVVKSQILIDSTLAERHPAISPDGTTIAYAAGTDVVSRKIYLHGIPDGDALRLTNDGYDDYSPTWSPDGRQIAYVGTRTGEPCHFFIIPVPAGTAREVGRCKTNSRSEIVWSRSGKEFYYVDRPDIKSFSRILRFDLASGHSFPVRAQPSGIAEDDPSPSPDGNLLSFCRYKTERIAWRVVMNLHDRSERILGSCADSSGTGWADDSRTLFVINGRGSEFTLSAQPLDGGEPIRLMSSPVDLGRISAGPHGLLAVEVNSADVRTAMSPLSGGERTLLDDTKGNDSTPDIAKDGTLAVLSWRHTGTEIRVKRRGGAIHKLIDLTAGEAEASEPRWSPDGSKLAFSTEVAGVDGIRVISASGADILHISGHGMPVNVPAWSADGRALIFPAYSGNTWRLYRAELEHPERIEPLSYTGWNNVRIRGNELYGVRDGAAGVWRIDGTPRRITPKPLASEGTEWAIHGDAIAYVDDAHGAKRQILEQPIAGGPAHVIAQVPGYAWVDGFAIDPVENAVIYGAAVNVDSDIELIQVARQ